MRGVSVTLQTSISFVMEECYSCGTLFGLTDEFRDHRIADKKMFYCPNGHGQIYLGKSLREQLAEAQRQLANAAEEARIQGLDANRKIKAAKDEAARLKKRSANGVCPCCNRSFVQLARHMATKHPEHQA